MDLWRYLMQRVFGAAYVVLIAHDGERRVCRVKWLGGRPCAHFYSLSSTPAFLADDGKLKGGPSYVEAWEPHIPFSRAPLPSYSTPA